MVVEVRAQSLIMVGSRAEESAMSSSVCFVAGAIWARSDLAVTLCLGASKACVA